MAAVVGAIMGDEKDGVFPELLFNTDMTSRYLPDVPLSALLTKGAKEELAKQGKSPSVAKMESQKAHRWCPGDDIVCCAQSWSSKTPTSKR
jgi:hypothetical protein